MSIVSSELVWRKSAEVSDAPTNGGRMSSTLVVSGVKNNIFPNAAQAERVAGSTKYRKLFLHVANNDSLALIDAKIFAMAPTPGDDRVLLFPGTQTDVQSGIASPQLYGAGTLNANANLGETTCTVLVENAADDIFKSGMTVRISNQQTINDAGDAQYLVLSQNASYVGNVATLTFTTTPLAYNFTVAGLTTVSSVLPKVDVEALVSDWVETSAGGTYNEAQYPVVAHGIGAIQQTWTLTFTSGTAFTVTGDTVGSVGSGVIGSNFVPSNPAYAKPYFTLLAAGWGGTWISGNTLVFKTSPAGYPFWMKRVIPPGATSLSGNKIRLGVDGESE